MSDFSKWDIVYTSKFPETIKCSSCNRYFMPLSSLCVCGTVNNISNIVAKIRPILLWIDKDNWSQSMAFAIPLSTSRLSEDKRNEIIFLNDFRFTHKDQKYYKPMRAIISQSTRVDGNVLKERNIIGRVIDKTKQSKIENKLLDWLFG
jgi:hypothetical protein